jgi:hypothetical protein
VIYSNPAATVKRVTVRGKHISLPTTDRFNALIAEMRAGHSRDSQNIPSDSPRLSDNP